MEVGASHFEVGKPARNASLWGEINGTKGNESNHSLAGREGAHFTVQSVAVQNDQGTPVRHNAPAMLDKLVIERSAPPSPSGVQDQDQDGPDVVRQGISQVPSDQGKDDEHSPDSSGQHPVSMLQKGSSNTSVGALAKSTATQDQLLWSISTHAVTIPWHVAAMIFLLVAGISCACTAFIVRRSFTVTEKKMQNPGIVDASGYQSGSHGFGDNQDFGYSERPFPEEPKW